MTPDQLVGLATSQGKKKGIDLHQNLELILGKISAVINRTLSQDYTIQPDTTLPKSDLVIVDGIEMTIADTGELLML